VLWLSNLVVVGCRDKEPLTFKWSKPQNPDSWGNER